MSKVHMGEMVAVVLSSNGGSGWFTNHRCEKLLYDEFIVAQVEKLSSDPSDTTVNAIESYLLTYYEECAKLVSINTIRNLRVEWVVTGQKFMVSYEDGHETIAYMDDFDWLEA